MLAEMGPCHIPIYEVLTLYRDVAVANFVSCQRWMAPPRKAQGDLTLRGMWMPWVKNDRFVHQPAFKVAGECQPCGLHMVWDSPVYGGVAWTLMPMVPTHSQMDVHTHTHTHTIDTRRKLLQVSRASVKLGFWWASEHSPLPIVSIYFHFF